MMQTRINLTPTRNHKIKSHYGTYNYFRHFKINNPKSEIDEILYRRLLRSLNEAVRDKIGSMPYDFKIPRRLGVIKVRKYYPEFRIQEDGTVENKLGIDFKSTLQLWEEDPEAREERVRVYFENEHSDGFIFKIKYDKVRARYKNKCFFMFSPNRTMKKLLSDNIKNKKIDAFLS